jgi:hypothetical protein
MERRAHVTLLQVDGDVAEVEKQQQRVIEDLRNQLAEAEHKVVSAYNSPIF